MLKSRNLLKITKSFKISLNAFHPKKSQIVCTFATLSFTVVGFFVDSVQVVVVMVVVVVVVVVGSSLGAFGVVLSSVSTNRSAKAGYGKRSYVSDAPVDP